MKTELLIAAKEIEQAGVDLCDFLCRQNVFLSGQTVEVNVSYLKNISNALVKAGQLIEKTALWKFPND